MKAKENKFVLSELCEIHESEEVEISGGMSTDDYFPFGYDTASHKSMLLI
jgi:hypothetical protein